jgi:hypothetical protein
MPRRGRHRARDAKYMTATVGFVGKVKRSHEGEDGMTVVDEIELLSMSIDGVEVPRTGRILFDHDPTDPAGRREP